MRNEFPKGNFEILQHFFKFLHELYFLHLKSIFLQDFIRIGSCMSSKLRFLSDFKI